MADYEPLIARAVAGLEQNTGENRRVLYERARGALLKQLRGVDPPLEEGDITRERLALEEAIRKVEAEVAAQEPMEQPAAAPAAEPAPEAEEPAPPPESPRPSLGDGGLKSFRQSMAQAEGLGGASAEANRAARESFGTGAGEPSAPPPPPPPETHYFEPEGEAGAPEEEHAPGEHAPSMPASTRSTSFSAMRPCRLRPSTTSTPKPVTRRRCGVPTAG